MSCKEFTRIGDSMKYLGIALIFCSAIFAEKATIDLAAYKNNKQFSSAETTYTIGRHTFTLLNIKPLHKTDTVCISAIVIDKRKYVLFDVGVEGAATGLIVPRHQPISDGLVVIKASPLEGKAFIFLSNGKVINLPGALIVTDTVGKNMYCVWENENQFRLTVFDYKNVRVVIPTTDIERPAQWYSNGVGLCFQTQQVKGYYTIDMFTKSISKVETAEGNLTPLSYLVDFSKVVPASCCSAQMLKK